MSRLKMLSDGDWLGRTCGAALTLLMFASVVLAMSAAPASAAHANNPHPGIRHVFIVVLENEGFAKTFGRSSSATYLSTELTRQGALLRNYYGIGHFSLDNYIAMISGQAPNPVTQSDCRDYVDFQGSSITASGQAVGRGCVYPAEIKTIADQLESAGLSWKAYMEDMGNNRRREDPACGRPKLGTRGEDLTQKAASDDQYAARHNPFVYFHSIVDRPVCDNAIVNLNVLKDDLQSVATTANFVFITPNLCHDGHDPVAPQRTCADGKESGGLASADAFLRQWVPQILASPAFQEDGLLIITFDETDSDFRKDPKSGATILVVDSRACCDERRGPNIGTGNTVFGFPDRGPGINGPGGGRTGAVLISPFIKPGTISRRLYNHYSLLKSVETIFDLSYLGYARQRGLRTFGPDVFRVDNRR